MDKIFWFEVLKGRDHFEELEWNGTAYCIWLWRSKGGLIQAKPTRCNVTQWYLLL